MWARRLEWMRERALVGVLISLSIHLGVIAALLLFGTPFTKVQVKRGEPLFVELPNIPEPAPAGNPVATSGGPAVDRPSPPAVKPPPTPSPAKPAPPAPTRPAPPPVVANRPAPPERPRAQPAPPRPAPVVPPTDASGPGATEAARPVSAPPEPAPSTPPEPPIHAPSSPPAPPAPQVAAVPPGAQTSPAPPVDIRSALKRGGGAGGTSNGRGGIEGEPIPLDSPDPRYSDYFDRVRRMIKERWGYPCVKNGDTRECEYKTTALVVEFGIAKDGKVPFVNVLRSSGWAIYDDYAVNAIKLAAPFPPVPDAISRKGIPVLARFNYMVDTSLTNFLR